MATAIALMRILLAALLLLLLAAIAFLLLHSLRGPPLKPWHRYLPDEPAADEIDQMDWPAWQTREAALFAATAAAMAEQLPVEDRLAGNRYWSGAPVHPARLPRDWNRSFELSPEGRPEGVAVLLHGLTDSPYSMRHLAFHYQKRGWAAIVIRLPGHGTVPAALARAGAAEWRAATRLALREARRLAPGAPLHLLGYSNGAALAIAHTLDALADPALGLPDRLLLLSPMIRIRDSSGLSQLARLPALLPPTAKPAWLDRLPEYNPFKYNSFPIHAGVEAEAMTRLVANGLGAAERNGAIRRFPPVLAFQSVADSTVSAQAVLDGFFDHLPENGSELVLFDINHAAHAGPLLRPAAATTLERLLPAGPRRYAILAVTNASPESTASVVRRRAPGLTAEQRLPLSIRYRPDFYSLGHVALPFPLSDGLYGACPDPADPEGVQLGTIAGHGESGLLQLRPGLLARVSSNPFFPWLLQQIDRSIDQTAAISGQAEGSPGR